MRTHSPPPGRLRAALLSIYDARYRRRLRCWSCPGLPDVSLACIRELITLGLAYTYQTSFQTEFVRPTDLGLEVVHQLRATKIRA